MALVSHVCGTTALLLQRSMLQLGELLWHNFCLWLRMVTPTPSSAQEDEQNTDLIRGPPEPFNHSVIT